MLEPRIELSAQDETLHVTDLSYLLQGTPLENA